MRVERARGSRTVRTLTGAALSLAAALAACATDEAVNGEGASLDASVAPDADSCGAFTDVGKACSPVSTRVCFPQCSTGGCSCRPGPAGQGVWQCTTDLTCYPEAGPLADTGALPPDPDPDADAADASDAGSRLDASREADAPSDR